MNIIPPINSKGLFSFAEPFASVIPKNQEYKVTSVRSLTEMYNSAEQPYETIYKIVGLTEANFADDVANNISIVVFASNGNEYFYVPSNRILSMPDISGIKYQEVILAVSLGAMPINYNLDLIKSNIVSEVYNTIGTQSNVKSVPSSAVILVTSDENAKFNALLANRKTVIKSWETQYLELKAIYDDLTIKHAALENYVISTK